MYPSPAVPSNTFVSINFVGAVGSTATSCGLFPKLEDIADGASNHLVSSLSWFPPKDGQDGDLGRAFRSCQQYQSQSEFLSGAMK